jgi:TetR/AcrR family transcriptional regulator, ethionamide resistance regulator
MATQRAETIQATSGRRRREATVADLLDATRRLLAAGTPVAQLSIERIVAEAGLARATFYLHFKDKHALITRLADDEVAWREEIGAEILADPHLQRAALDQIMLEIVSRWVADQPVLSAIIELAEYDPAVRVTWRAAMHQVAVKAATQFQARWVDSPDRPPDPDMIAEIFTWMFERSCHQLLSDPSRAESVASSMAEIIWRVLDYRAAD